MKCLLVTGSYPPDICGVGDYTSKVITSEFAKREKWELYYVKKGWKFRYIINRLRDIIKLPFKTIIFEMPTLGYGKSLSPHIVVALLSIFSQKKIIVRLHEYSQLSRKARLAVSIMLMTANLVIFTNEYDRKKAAQTFTRLKNKSAVVKIYSNISQCKRLNDYNERKIDIAYFGHIRPLKGIERFIDCITHLQSYNRVESIIIGQVPQGYDSYFEKIKALATKAGISLKINASEEEVGKFLNNSKVAFLPFPDGISERRGSFLAAISNGCPVISTPGEFSKGEISKAAILSDNHRNQESSIIEILNNEQLWEKCQSNGFNFLKKEMPSSWSDVAKKYTQAIQNI